MPMRSRDVNRRRSVGSAVSERIADRRAFDVLGWASMIPYRYSPRRMFNLLRVGLYEVRDGLATRFPRRLPAVVDYNPDADICGAFAECLRRNGFPEHADTIWKEVSSDDWKDVGHAFAEDVMRSGNKEAARIGAEVVSDCLEHFESRMKAKAVAKVKLDISNLRFGLSGPLYQRAC